VSFPMIIATAACVRLDLDGIVVHDVQYLDGSDEVPDQGGMDALFERLAASDGPSQQPAVAALADDDSETTPPLSPR